MKNIPVLLMLTLFSIACSSTKNDLKMSRQPVSGHAANNGSAVAATSAGQSHASNHSPMTAPVYASNKKLITIQENASTNAPVVIMPSAAAMPGENNQDEALGQKITVAQMEMFHQMEMDREIATVGLKKVMQRKVYTTEVKILNDSSASSTIVSRDTVYSVPQSRTWFPVE